MLFAVESETRKILEYATTIAVVGASTNADKPGASIPLELQRHGYRILPVNPTAPDWFGAKVYKSLGDLPEKPDVVEVFRPAGEAPEIARQAVAIGAKALWLQTGIASHEARQIAQAGGLDYVEDRCMGVERTLNRIEKTPG